MRKRIVQLGAVALAAALAATASGSAGAATKTTKKSTKSTKTTKATATTKAAAGTPTTKAAAASGGTYTIGLSLDLSGGFAANGQGISGGFSAYVDAVNKAGGVNGYKINVEKLDDASRPDRGAANYTQLVTDKKAIAVGGYVLSNVCGATAPLAAEKKVTLVCNALGDDLLNPVQPYVYAARIATSNEAAPAVRAVELLVRAEKMRIAYIGLASAAIRSMRDNVLAIAKTKGWDVVASEEVALTATDVSAQVSKVLASKPSVIISALNDPLIVLMSRTMQSQDSQLQVINYDGGSSLSSFEASNNPNLYMLRTFEYAVTNPDTEGLKKYMADMKAADISPNTAYSVNGYVMAMIMVSALQNCAAPCTTETYRASLDGLKVDTKGLTPAAISFTATNHEALHAMNLYVYDGAKKEMKRVYKEMAGGAS